MATESTGQSNGGMCPCGSGLPYQQCCGETAERQRQDQGPSKRQLAQMLGQARQALQTGDKQKAEAVCSEILKHDSAHFGALRLLTRLRRQADDTQTAEKLLGRLQSLYPNNDEVMVDTAEFALARGQIPQAEQMLANAVRVNPRNFQAHVSLGSLKLIRGDLAQSEYHLRQAHYLNPAEANVCAKLAGVLSALGRHDEGERFYRIAHNLQPKNIDILLGWVKLEESRGDVARATRLLEQAGRLEGAHKLLPLSEASLKRREGDAPGALETLDGIHIDELAPRAAASVQFERGHVLEQLGRYADAFGAYTEANRIYREQLGMKYVPARAQEFFDSMKRFFTREQMTRLPRAVKSNPDDPEPIFIVGFPRSGSILVEQILSAHPNISAGRELHYIPSGVNQAPMLVRSRRPYPDCLDELTLPGNEGVVQQLRNRYLVQARLEGLLDPGSNRFTDKMPLNEIYLGYISLLFPDAPIVHVLRNPLDAILSSYFNDTRAGDLFSFDLHSCAAHYMHAFDLLDRYKQHLDLNYHQVRYEDLVKNTAATAKSLFEFVGESWDERFLQTRGDVHDEIHDHALGRHEHYAKYLAEVAKTVGPAMQRYDYA